MLDFELVYRFSQFVYKNKKQEQWNQLQRGWGSVVSLLVHTLGPCPSSAREAVSTLNNKCAVAGSATCRLQGPRGPSNCSQDGLCVLPESHPRPSRTQGLSARPDLASPWVSFPCAAPFLPQLVTLKLQLIDLTALFVWQSQQLRRDCLHSISTLFVSFALNRFCS